jgi:phospholipase C
MLVVSPFSAGGYVCSDPFDHTSQLRFLETVFGVTAPNISAWRRGATGDLTSALPVLGTPVVRPPKLPVMSSSVTTPPVDQCSATDQLEINPPASTVTPFTIPKHQVMPTQPKGRLKRTPS